MTPPDDYRRQYAASLGEVPHDEAAFHAALHDAVARGDSLPSLVYADWLEEHGKPAHAAVIRQHSDPRDLDVEHGVKKPGGWDMTSHLTLAMRYKPSGFSSAHATLNYPENTHGHVNLRIQSHTDKRRHFSWTSAWLPVDQLAAMIHQLRREGAETSPVTDGRFPPEPSE